MNEVNKEQIILQHLHSFLEVAAEAVRRGRTVEISNFAFRTLLADQDDLDEVLGMNAEEPEPEPEPEPEGDGEETDPAEVGHLGTADDGTTNIPAG